MRPQIVFFGSGPVATKSIELLATDFDIEAIITKPTTLKDMQHAEIPNDTKILSVSTKKELDELIKTEIFTSKIGILIDFGIIVSQHVIDSFERGIINSHFSLLPEWRGADPITFSILSGQKRTGVSLMSLVPAMDEGPIIACGIYDLNGRETTPELTQGLIRLSDALLKANIPNYITGKNQGIPQPDVATQIPDYPTKASYSRKLTKEDGVLDFAKPAAVLEREIRAFTGWPKSRTSIAGKDCIILSASVDNSRKGKLGKVFKTEDQRLGIQTTEGALIVDQIQPSGKKPMDARSFLAGYGTNL